MNPRENYFAYLEDLAKRHVDINHTAANPRFYQQVERDIIQGGANPNTTGWVMIALPFHGNGRDNKAQYRPLEPRLYLKILKHVPQSDQASLVTVMNTAFDIGWEIIQMMRKHQEQCLEGGDTALTNITTGIAHFRGLDLDKVGFDEWGPEFDNFYGYVFDLQVIIDRDVPIAVNPAKWQVPT